MRKYLLLCSIVLPFWGCTSVALRHSTVAVGSTVSSILEQQALDNLGRFIDDGDGVPSLLVLNAGTITVQNKAIPSFKLPFQFADPTKAFREVDLGLEMDWQEAWGTFAVVSENDLKDIRVALNDVIENAQIKTMCDINVATKAKTVDAPAKPRWQTTQWLCVDPTSSPIVDPVVLRDRNRWIYKGSHHGHEFWVANILFADFVVGLSGLHHDVSKQKTNQLLIAPSPPPLL